MKIVVQEIEQRVSKQADNMRKVTLKSKLKPWYLYFSLFQSFQFCLFCKLLLQQSNLYKSREDRYHSKVRALETLATGTTEENEVLM